MTNLKPHDTLFWATVVDDLLAHKQHDRVYVSSCVICQFEREERQRVEVEDSSDAAH